MIKIIGLLAFIFTASFTHAASEKWTFGLGLGNQTLADYRGSSYYQSQFLPIPFVMYRGDIIKIDRDGARGDLWKNDRLEFNISVDASLNGNSENNPLRVGMPKLDTALEIGPSINVRLTGEDFSSGWSLRFPLRAIYTVNSSGFENIGFVFSPKLSWKEDAEKDQWQSSLNIGPVFSDADYHNYYYGILPEYVLPSRPGYETQSGYSGSFVKVGIKKQFDHWWFATYLRYDYLGGATFVDSPLVEEKDSATVGFAVVRVLAFD